MAHREPAPVEKQRQRQRQTRIHIDRETQTDTQTQLSGRRTYSQAVGRFQYTLTRHTHSQYRASHTLRSLTASDPAPPAGTDHIRSKYQAIPYHNYAPTPSVPPQYPEAIPRPYAHPFRTSFDSSRGSVGCWLLAAAASARAEARRGWASRKMSLKSVQSTSIESGSKLRAEEARGEGWRE
eukprot:1670355-Rhodomonas_salina.8